MPEGKSPKESGERKEEIICSEHNNFGSPTALASAFTVWLREALETEVPGDARYFCVLTVRILSDQSLAPLDTRNCTGKTYRFFRPCLIYSIVNKDKKQSNVVNDGFLV